MYSIWNEQFAFKWVLLLLLHTQKHSMLHARVELLAC